MLTVEIDIEDVGNNMVGFLSQIGWTNVFGGVPIKKIHMEKIFVYADKSFDILDEIPIAEMKTKFHSKVPHRTKLYQTVMSCLQY